jgi:hypothetical protein
MYLENLISLATTIELASYSIDENSMSANPRHFPCPLTAPKNPEVAFCLAVQTLVTWQPE